MISLLPSYSETIVTPLQRTKVVTCFEGATAQSIEWDQSFILPQDKLFYGYVHDHHFQLALRALRLFSFNPLVQGKLESTPAGCIIFLKYQLFVLTRIILLFWSGFLVVGGLLLSVLKNNYWYSVGAILILTAIHLIVHANFRLHLKPTQRAIFDLIGR